MTIAVSGTSGHLGRLVVEGLKARAPDARLVALARDPAKVQSLGVEARRADYDLPGTLDGALSGVDALVLVSSSEVGKRIVQHRAVIEAAKGAGIGWIVYTSLLHADASSLGLAAEHRATEADLRASGLATTIHRHGWYTENFADSIGAALASGTLVGSAGEGKISSAARADFAEAIVAVLTGEGHEGKTYELAGDAAWTLRDLADEVSRQTGREILLQSPARPHWDAGASEGVLFDDGRQLSTLIGRPTTPLSKSVAEALKAFV